MESINLVNTHISNLACNYKLEKQRTIILGIAFIMATVTAIIGLKLYDPILINENFLTINDRQQNQVASGAIFEMLLVCANSFTAILMYPYLRLFSRRLGIAYICFRVLEAVTILIGIVSVLALLSVSQSYQKHPASNLEMYNVIGIALKAIHYWTFILGPNFLLGVNTLIYSYVFYKSGLVPRKLSVWGITGALLVFTVALLEIFEIVPSLTIGAVLMAMPIAIYEMVLAGWLIANGFNVQQLKNKISADNSK